MTSKTAHTRMRRGKENGSETTLKLRKPAPRRIGALPAEAGGRCGEEDREQCALGGGGMLTVSACKGPSVLLAV